MGPLDREAPLDGFRAIVHASLVALHVSMLTTGHVPSSGALWDGIRKHPVYTIAQAGGTQVLSHGHPDTARSQPETALQLVCAIRPPIITDCRSCR